MPGSRFVSWAIDQVARIRPSATLDVGCGYGFYGLAVRGVVDVYGSKKYPDKKFAATKKWKNNRVDAVEVYEPYIRSLQREIYDDIFICDIYDGLKSGLVSGPYDLVLCIDVIEHIEKERGIYMLSKLFTITDYVIVVTPVDDLRDNAYGDNVYEKHISTWCAEDFFKVVDKKYCDTYEEIVEDKTKLCVLINVPKAKFVCLKCGGELVRDLFADRDVQLLRCRECGEEYEC